MAERDARAPASQPLQVTGKAMVVFTLTAPTPDQIAHLERHLESLATRLREEHGAEFEADNVAGKWETEVDGAPGRGGWSFGKDNQLGALKAWHDGLMAVFPPENRPPEHQWVVDQQTALIREFAEAENAEDPAVARRAIIDRLEREMRERFRRFTGKDPDEV